MFVLQLAFPAVSNLALFVDQVNRGPVLLLPSIPVSSIRVDQDRIADSEFLHPLRTVGGVLLFLGLRRVDANDLDPLLLEPLLPSAVTRQVPPAVDSPKGPEFHDGDFVPSARQFDRLILRGIEPRSADQLRRR